MRHFTRPLNMITFATPNSVEVAQHPFFGFGDMTEIHIFKEECLGHKHRWSAAKACDRSLLR